MYLQPHTTTMAISNPTPDESWMYKEVNEKKLAAMKIYTSEYSKDRMALIRKSLKLKRVSAKRFAEFFNIDIYLFYPLKTLAD